MSKRERDEEGQEVGYQEERIAGTGQRRLEPLV